MKIPKIKILDKNFNYQNNKLYLKVEYRFNLKIKTKTKTHYTEDEYNPQIKFMNEKISFLNDKIFVTKNIQKLNEHINDNKIQDYLEKFRNGIERFNDKNIDFRKLIDGIFYDIDLNNLRQFVKQLKEDSNYDQNILNNIQKMINSHINQLNENYSKKQVLSETEFPEYDKLIQTHELNQIATNDDIIKYLKEKHKEFSQDFKKKKILKKEKDELPDEIF